MLKLPKGLKKKKKGKKKKDQELFTEAELEQYKRDHQAHPEQSEEHHPEKAAEGNDEWSQFAALTTGIDSVLKKTQGDLDRIKETSFFKRVPPPSEKKAAEQAKAEREAEEVKEEPRPPTPTKAQQLLNAVVELSDSDDDSYYDEAFDTTFTDRVDELPLAYIPDSPEEETDLGPDPFDTGYAEKVIKGPEISARGKKLVNIGVAVDVLTGKVETAATSSKTRRQRRGIQNLMLESFEINSEEGDAPPTIITSTLLDEPAELDDNVTIDLSKSLHLNMIQKPKKEGDENDEGEADDFELALSKVELSFGRPKEIIITPCADVPDADWSEFELEADKSEFYEHSRPVKFTIFRL